MTDLVAILEAAYTLDGDEERWLYQLGETARLNSNDGRWLVARTYDVSQGSIVPRAMAYCGVEESPALTSLSQLDVRLCDEKTTLQIVRHGFRGSDLSPRQPELQRPVQIFQRSFVRSVREAPRVLLRAGFDQARVREFEGVLSAWLKQWDMGDELWVNAQDPTGIGCTLVAPMRRQGLHPHEVRGWRCVAAHIASAFRVRRKLAAESRDPLDGAIPLPEAILDPEGRLEHAEEPAKTDPARAALYRAVRRLGRARGPLRRSDPAEAVALWQALVAGRWSLLDHFDSDGRRFVLAHRNDVRTPDLRGLTPRECQVLGYAALGHSNKVIAYELGLSTSTVAGHLSAARRKLGLRSWEAIRDVLDAAQSASADASSTTVAKTAVGRR